MITHETIQRLLARRPAKDTGRVRAPLLADLRLWHAWHRDRGTLPADASDESLAAACRALGLPAVEYLRPWHVEMSSGVDSRVAEERIQRWQFGPDSDHLLTASWEIGPDGDFWQTQYPVQTAEDLRTVIAYLEKRMISVDSDLVETMVPPRECVTIVELPSRPFSWLMLELVGWSEGIMLLFDAPDLVAQLLELAEEQIDRLTRLLLKRLPASILLSPDNLDSQFVTPGFFAEHLGASYQSLAQAAHQHDHVVVVHTGGPIASLVKELADAGIDSVAGVAEPPQGDAGISRVIELSDRRVVPWGGIPQDVLMPVTPVDRAIETVRTAIAESEHAEFAILGFADHVPIEAEASRIIEMVEVVTRS